MPQRRSRTRWELALPPLLRGRTTTPSPVPVPSHFEERNALHKKVAEKTNSIRLIDLTNDTASDTEIGSDSGSIANDGLFDVDEFGATAEVQRAILARKTDATSSSALPNGAPPSARLDNQTSRR